MIVSIDLVYYFIKEILLDELLNMLATSFHLLGVALDNCFRDFALTMAFGL